MARAISEASNGRPIVNLASQEYFKAVDLKALKNEVITIHFKEFKNNQYQTIGFFAKQARGLMTNFAIKNRISSPEDLKGFNLEGYEFSSLKSGNEDWVFVR
ncbi:YaaA family protein [Algoriphagus boritolerans]|uniref:YaaA family protein n=1 Tax=Algoriphagus boritolerans TaxID=308111 RepID=UPI002FCE4899